MPVAPLDLKQLYMQQGHIGKIEHAKVAAYSLSVQSEDKDISKDSYEKDSTVVKNEEATELNLVKERKEHKKDQDTRFMHYRKKKYRDNDDEIFDTVVDNDNDDENIKGKHIDLFG